MLYSSYTGMTILNMSGMRLALLVVLTATVGSLSGAVTAFVVTPYVAPVQIQYRQPVPPIATSTNIIDTTVPPALVKLESHLATPLIPPEFVHRGVSPVATLYRKPKGTTLEEKTLTDDHVLGQAVAMTSDGWFITMAIVLTNQHLADLTLWHNDTGYEITQAIIDHVNGTVYLKTAARDVPAAGFGQVIDLLPGSELWTERRAGFFAPTLLMSLVDPHAGSAITSSEIASRRILIDGNVQAGDVGSPVWDVRGSLIGLVDGGAGNALRILPVTSISTSLNSLLTNNRVIRHAQLGVRSRDLALWRIDGDRGTLPPNGAFVVEDKKKVGLKSGDVILAIEHDTLDGTQDLGELLSEYKMNAQVVLHIKRNGVDMTIPTTLGAVTTSEAFK